MRNIQKFKIFSLSTANSYQSNKLL